MVCFYFKITKVNLGGGVCGEIHNNAGPELEKECVQLAPIDTGSVVFTKSYNIRNITSSIKGKNILKKLKKL